MHLTVARNKPPLVVPKEPPDQRKTQKLCILKVAARKSPGKLKRKVANLLRRDLVLHPQKGEV